MDMLSRPGRAALRKGRVSLPAQIYLVTATTHKRRSWFADFTCAAVAARCFERSAQDAGSELLTWVLMPDHAHWLLRLGSDETLSAMIKRLKSVSAQELNKLQGRSGPVWDAGFHDHALRSDEEIKTVARYVIANPLRAGLVGSVGDYPFWNSIWL